MNYDVSKLPKPLGSRLLVEEVAIEMKTESGILQAGFGIGGFSHCRVLAVGPDVKEVRLGDIVYFREKLAEPVRVPDGILAVIDEKMIYARQEAKHLKIVDRGDIGEKRILNPTGAVGNLN